MSDGIKKTIKQIENQNKKLKKLLDATLEFARKDTLKIAQLENQSEIFKRTVQELEDQKRQLQKELDFYLADDKSTATQKLQSEDVDINKILEDAVEEIKSEFSDIDQLKIDDAQLEEVLQKLEEEKRQLLQEIELVKEASNNNDKLVQLKNELTVYERENGLSLSSSSTGQAIVTQLASLDKLKGKFKKELEKSKSSCPLSVPTENSVLELKISSLEKRRNLLLKELRAVLLSSAQEMSNFHANAQNILLNYLINELEAHKALLLVNVVNLKESSISKVNSETKSVEIEEPKEHNLEQPDCILPTVSEEEETLSHLYAEHELLSREVTRLEQERQTLLQQLRAATPFSPNREASTSNILTNANALHSTFMREESWDDMPLRNMDDATNHLLGSKEDMLTQRIRDLELDNQMIKIELEGILERNQQERIEVDVMKLARDLANRTIRNLQALNEEECLTNADVIVKEVDEK